MLLALKRFHMHGIVLRMRAFAVLCLRGLISGPFLPQLFDQFIEGSVDLPTSGACAIFWPLPLRTSPFTYKYILKRRLTRERSASARLRLTPLPVIRPPSLPGAWAC